MKLKFLMAPLFSLFFIANSYAQGWEQFYPKDSIPITESLVQTIDNGFMLAARYYDNAIQKWIPYVVKTDVNGDTLWTKELDLPTTVNNVEINNIKQTTDGGYILAGEGNQDIYLAKTDANGDTLWSKTYGGASTDYCRKVQQTIDGGYILFGTTWVGAGNADFYLIKTDANGNMQWTQTYGGAGIDQGSALQQTVDGGYILIGNSNSFGLTSSDYNAYLIKTDASGNAQWTQNYGGPNYETGDVVQQTIDGGYILGQTSFNSGTGSSLVLTKVDALGGVEWSNVFNNGTYSQLKTLLKSTDGGYVLFGRMDNADNNILKINALGGVEWSRSTIYSNNSSFAEGVNVGNGYAVAGHYSTNITTQGLLLIRTDSLGNTYTNYIKGNVFNDTNTNCSKDVGERDLSGILVEAAGSQVWYGTTDSLGNYCIQVDTGSYVVTADVPLYWQTCANGIPVTLSSGYINDTIDFPFQVQTSCAMMEVDLSASFLRIGGATNYTVSYCNKGTSDAVNALIEVDIDLDLNILSTSIPIANQTGNSLIFNLGTVAYGDCGSFNIQVEADTSAILGQTHCSEAHVYPDTLCVFNTWTGPIIAPDATCQNDSVAFKLENIGGGPFNSETYYVFEDHVIMRTGNTGNIPVSGSFDLIIPADTGKTYRITIPQNVGYPKLLGDSIASVAIEGCVPYFNGTFNTGFITQFSNGNSAPFIAVDCQPNIGSYDPNDKSAQPKGYEAPNYIYNYTDLDYKIRFQNTGTDTAFLVVIRDTISPLLDLTTLKMGASSHNYTWRVYGERILEITFDNIMLPDSNVNEPASNGFVRYRIEQNDGNVVGDVIYNAADIYFDFNAPIRTNTTFHTIGENFVTIVLDQPKVLEEVINVKVYPNPFTQQATIEVEGETYDELQLSIYDVSGRTILEQQVSNNNRIELSRGNLQAGVYFYQLLGDNNLISTGKIIVQ